MSVTNELPDDAEPTPNGNAKYFYYEVWKNKYPHYAGNQSWADFEFDYCALIEGDNAPAAFKELTTRLTIVNDEEKSNNVKFKLRNFWEV